MNKIKTIEELAERVKLYKIKGQKIVHCHGVFDLLHIGHIRYFEQARQMGDILIVTVTADRFVDKGPHRPAFTETLRAEAVASLKCVDYVAINLWSTAENTLRKIMPDFYVKGSEFKEKFSDRTGKIDAEIKVIQEIGAQIAFTEDIVFSSTNLINTYLSKFPEEIDNYLNFFRKRYSLEKILEIIENMSSLNVLVIGDTILDEYQYCSAIGKSSKDPVLALKYQSRDLFAGGVLAVANHVANFADKVQLVTILGEHDRYEDFIRSQLHQGITPFFTTQDGAPTLIKKRFIEGYSLNKLFEVYVMDDSGLSEEKDIELCEWLRRELPNYDLVIVADFGHGTISNQMADVLRENARFLAVNTQSNAGNRGFHTISRYPNANFVCIAEHEARLELRDLKMETRPLMETLFKRFEFLGLVVTLGRNGCAILNENSFIQVPSFAQDIVDRVGAGDAFFSITSLAMCMKTHIEIVGFLGNVVGALAVKILGNKKSIDKLSVEKLIVSLMK